MPLTKLPQISFPVRPQQVNPLMENVAKFSVIDFGIAERMQKALDLEFHAQEIKADTGGAIDYTGRAGHAKLAQDAMTFVGDGCPIVTRHGDLKAAYLAIAWNDAQAKLAAAGMPLLSDDVNTLLTTVQDILTMPQRTEDRMALFLSYLRKKPPV